MDKPIIDYTKLDPPEKNTGPLPDITLIKNQDDYELMVAANARAWAVIDIHPGAWRRLASNFERTEHASYEDAMAEAKRRYDEATAPKRGSLIYAIADFPGARNMTCCYDEWPRNSGVYGSFYRRQIGKGSKPNKQHMLPPVGTIEPSERYFEASAEKDYAGSRTTASVVKVGKSQRALRYQAKRR
jgi:hypothetical protein